MAPLSLLPLCFLIIPLLATACFPPRSRGCADAACRFQSLSPKRGEGPFSSWRELYGTPRPVDSFMASGSFSPPSPIQAPQEGAIALDTHPY